MGAVIVIFLAVLAVDLNLVGPLGLKAVAGASKPILRMAAAAKPPPPPAEENNAPAATTAKKQKVEFVNR